MLNVFVFTLSRRSAAIQLKPIIASHCLVPVMFSNTAFHVPMKPPPELNLRPSIDLTCVVIVEIAAAVVKPPMTGELMKSTRKPMKKPQNSLI